MDFIMVEGQQLVLADQPYYFLGTNLWYAANLAAEGHRDRLVEELDQLNDMGINNIRILGASEGAGSYRIHRTFQPRPGEYDEDLLVGLDYVLAEMGKRSMHAVIYLTNFWEWSGGMAQYVAWSKRESFPKPILDEKDRPAFIQYSASFYSNPTAQRLFQEYVVMLMNRANTITGMLYRDDPTIMSWQLANEPRPGRLEDTQATKASYLAWIRDTANLIKELDPNHLVSTGSEGLVGSGLSEEIFLAAHALDEIDYITFHLWALNWDWFDPEDAEVSFPDALKKAQHYLESHYAYASELGKPLTLEEFGFPRDLKAFNSESFVVWRDKYYTEILRSIHDNAMQGGPTSGSNFWAWGGMGRTSNPDYIWKPGDEYMGDPPQEPQGLYSVFSTDTSTLSILEAYARKMQTMNRRSS